MSEVVDRERYFIPYNVTHLPYVFFKNIEPFFGNLDAGHRMRRHNDLITFLSVYHFCGNGPVLNVKQVRRIFFHIVDASERSRNGARFVEQQADSEIHFQKRKSHFHAFFKLKPHIVPAVFSVYIGITVHSDSVAKFTAEQLIYGNTPRFSGNIPQCNFNTADAAALPRVTSELFDFSENSVHIARIFPQDPRLQHKSECLTRRIAHFTVTFDTLIRQYFKQRTPLRRSVYVDTPHIGNF